MSATTEGPLQVLADLQRGAKRLVTMSIGERQKLLHACIDGIEQTWEEWVELAWKAKRIPAGDGSRAEDILSGPMASLRYLRLLDQTLEDIAKHGQPRLPGKPRNAKGGVHVPIFPTHQLFDRILFGPIQAHVRMSDEREPRALFGERTKRVTGASNDEPVVTLVLGAGNVSSIPITDSFTKIFQDSQAVLLKMNPVNAYLGPIFEKAMAPLMEADLLRVVYGGGDVGASLIAANEIDRVHITGSDRTHDAIVWGGNPEQQSERKAKKEPLLEKPITSELGNVSPWIIVPGNYTERQLRFQAENIVASVTNNASFNCIATKMLITSKSWTQRELFLNMIDEILSPMPRRFPYYPGAVERYSRFAGKPAKDPEQLPWTLRRDVDPTADTKLFSEESFVCVFGETTLDANSPSHFLDQAVDFANEEMWGTLSAGITVPTEFQKQHDDDLDAAIDRLQYGIVGINQWPGVAFALMSPPWGAYPGSTLCDIQSGIGSVHNTYLLDNPEKTVIMSPLTIFPKPIWFSTHRCPESVARSLLQLYLKPSVWRIPPVLGHAIRG